MQSEVDGLLRETLESTMMAHRGRRLSAIGLVLEQFHHAVADRRVATRCSRTGSCRQARAVIQRNTASRRLDCSPRTPPRNNSYLTKTICGFDANVRRTFARYCEVNDGAGMARGDQTAGTGPMFQSGCMK